jgi:cytokinesis protein
VAAQSSFTPSVTMPSIRPKKKLKAVHWEKIDTPQVTVWATHAPTYEAKEEKYTELAKKGVLDEVERLFMAKETKILGGGPSTKQRKDKKQIISNDLSKNFQIAMAKFSQIPVDELVRKIIHCDPEILDNSVVMDFLQRDDLCNIPENTAKLMAPYGKDWTVPDAALSEREQDPNELTREDQIYLQTAFELNHYWKSRMRALTLTRSFESDYDHICRKIREVVKACDSLRDSVSLMNVLGLILDIGNFMNDANKQAQGFKLSSLARLGMVKDDKNETTFADLVERIVRNQYPEWEGFIDEIGGVLAVHKLNIDQLRQDAKKFIDMIKNVQMSLDSGNLSDPKKFHPQDRVSQIVQRSMKDARRKAEQMQIYLEDVSKTYDDIMTFYGEDSADENARRDFFAKLATFLQEWKVCYSFHISVVCSCLYPSETDHIRVYRNPKKRICNWKRREDVRRPLWYGSASTLLSPMALARIVWLLRRRAVPWTLCWRSCGQPLRRQEISETAVVVPDSRSDIKCALRPDRRSPVSQARVVRRMRKGTTKQPPQIMMAIS